ncbi:MAG: hypothetical protein QG652_27 [Pseudomonadota bacterium]|nr:hypothetical protein [Pseudomonadota bacterium]
MFRVVSQKISILFLFSTLLLIACGKNTKPDNPPDWISNPGAGATGSAVTHVKGRYYQEELATSRARERLAAQYGVEISSVQTIHEHVINDRAYVTSEKQMLQQISNQTVKTHIRAIWHDKAKDEVWVWVYPVAE